MVFQGLSIVAVLFVGWGIARPIVGMLTAPPVATSAETAALAGGGTAAVGQLSYDQKVSAVKQLVDRDAERVARIVKEWVGADG